MNIEQLITKSKPISIIGQTDVEINGIEIDSRKILPGKVFVAIRGTQTDGHNFISKAIELGATAIVCEQLPSVLSGNVVYIQYQSTEEVVGQLATNFYGNPTSKIKLVGVTGTNGKTTIATLLYQIFRRLGYKCGLCSTVCNYIDGTPIPTECTTPDPITLNALLGRMADEGCDYAFIEVSSHSVSQHRIGGLTFAGGIFTNLTQDHLDYHQTFENYRDAKKAFFDSLPASAFAITNTDDKNGLFMTQNTKARIKSYSLKNASDYKAKILEESFEGMSLEIDGQEVFVQFVGRFNASNLLAAYGALCQLGVDSQEALIQLSAATPVNGRFEAIHSKEGVTAIVDYAHTPDALANVLSTINEVLRNRGKCWTVCGAGGNRDKGKRPLMAQEAYKQSDHVIITSDNPRFEDPQDIINDMLDGLDKEQRRHVISIVDRKEAIRTACMMANPGDVILVAGKGHEDYQIIQGTKHHFDDHEVICEAFNL
ncbi:MAG: UDP-N-acetylmuramoyl-L-alanyl-D-glutamate--2,6-diaminopimelate ligase [Bacteroidaceae bacterium]|nr:UDP-N-acetylmuramoyl-L-alanyl-D-glutamate--2,6-diaminopimelate ligase [Bacteroidaceae bacterium]